MSDIPRPRSMQVFDEWSERCLLEFEAQKDAGKKIFGIYCVFAPTELVRAAGGIPVGLFGNIGRTDRVEQAGLSVIDVPHNGDDRRTRHSLARSTVLTGAFGRNGVLRKLLFEA